MSQVVFPSDVGDLFGLHGLQLWTVCDTMPQTTAKCAAPLSYENKKADKVFEYSLSKKKKKRHTSQNREM